MKLDYAEKKLILNKLILNAEKQVGVKVVIGGTKPAIGFDCSGLIDYLFRSAGFKKFPDERVTSYSLFKMGIIIDKDEEIKGGDLIFTSEHHVMLALDSEKVIEANIQDRYVRIKDMPDKILRVKRLIPISDEEEQIERLKHLVENYFRAEECNYTEQTSAANGRIDDIFSDGVSKGESVLAYKIGQILKMNLPNIELMEDKEEYDYEVEKYL